MKLRHFFTANRWWGKLLGGFFGYLMAGSAGALFGILIGNFFDRGLAVHFSKPAWSYNNEKSDNVQQLFIQAAFSVMGHIAKADGRVSEHEIKTAEQIIDEMRLNRKQKKMAKIFFMQGKQADFNLDRTLALLHSVCHVNPYLLNTFIDFQYRVAKVDGLTEQKMQLLNYILNKLGFVSLHRQNRFYQDFDFNSYSNSNNRQYQQYTSREGTYQRPNNPLAHAYAVLEVNQNAAKQEVKKAYRRLISVHHPDKLIAKGASADKIKHANEKTQQLTKAYEKICASKGW